MKSVNILGSTGSIGSSSLEIINDFATRYQINILSAASNDKKLVEQIKKFRPKYAFLADPLKRQNLPNIAGTKIISEDEYFDLLSRPHDITICGISGIAALKPTIAAIKGCKTLGLANKEVVVCAFSFIKQLLDYYKVRLIPLDSEHNAIYQMIGFDISQINDVIITASGGPFYGQKFADFYNADVAKALKHPTWSMGDKISVDSATMMNKGLELIEACELFALPSSKVNVLVHRQSKAHAIVNFIDGSSFMQINESSMKLHIATAFASDGERLHFSTPAFDLASAQLTFEKLDSENFTLPKLAMQVYDTNDISMRIKLNNYNEHLVKLFLNNQIKFGQIIDQLHQFMETHKASKISTLEDLINYSQEISLNFKI